jgi:hypothetical protein
MKRGAGTGPNEAVHTLLAYFCTDSPGTVPAGPLARGGECEAFRRWIDGLPARGHEALVQLRQCGFTYDLAALRRQLSGALLASPAERDSRSVACRLVDLLARLDGVTCFLLEEAIGPAEPSFQHVHC